MTKEQAFVVARAVGVFIAAIVALLVSAYLFRISYPFVIAAFIAWLFSPLLKVLKIKFKFPSTLASLTTVLIGISVLGGIITGITFLIIYIVQQISDQLPGWIEQGAMQLQQMFNQLILPIWQEMNWFIHNLSGEQQQTLQQGITELGNQVGSILGNFAQSIANGMTNIVSGIPVFLFALIFVILAVYFIGKDIGTMKASLQSRIPVGIQTKFVLFTEQVKTRVWGFIRAQLILMTITTVIVLIGLLVLDVEYAITLALITGLAEILPYLGTGTILIPWGIYSLVTGDIFLGISLLVLYVVVVIVRQSLEPKVLSVSMNLNTLAVLFSLFVGFQVLGVIGLFLGPALLVVLTILKDIGVITEVEQFIRHGFIEETPPDKK
ncbi:sporulation integral membrane protein YtvI [Geomicrobium sediminis]|uniref:Sporulation integral membrane protein YtvI n=1 Tax=Geomicrobium sediminis TaxID=1347788 RepID=A0ABS2PI58_9BACL|nr:sporulation integral membrane protein YtvI [Geomicrobium sediminis]MBM7634786.1 sporulation integral membrane protein YtvI [Geomicrobium sediminis]